MHKKTTRLLPIWRYANRGLRRAASLLETSIVLLILTASLSVGAVLYYNYLENRTNQIAAEEMRLVTTAFSTYLEDNYGSVLEQAEASAPAPYVVEFDELKDGSYIYSSFENLNPFGQEYHLATRYADGRLESVVYTSGGDVISGKNAHTIAQLIGAGGGYTNESGDSAVKATLDGYDLDISHFSDLAPGAGKLVSTMLFTGSGTNMVSDFIYRNEIPGQPELNTMNTDLHMGGYSIDDIDTVSTGTAIIAGEASVGTTLRVAGTSRLQGNVGIGGDSTGDALTVYGDALVTDSLLIGGNQAGWHLSDPESSGEAWLTSYNGKTIYTSGDIIAGSRIQGQHLQAKGEAVLNESCELGTSGDENLGLIARTDTGLLLSCQSSDNESGQQVMAWKAAMPGGSSEYGCVEATYVDRHYPDWCFELSCQSFFDIKRQYFGVISKDGKKAYIKDDRYYTNSPWVPRMLVVNESAGVINKVMGLRLLEPCNGF